MILLKYDIQIFFFFLVIGKIDDVIQFMFWCYNILQEFFVFVQYVYLIFVVFDEDVFQSVIVDVFGFEFYCIYIFVCKFLLFVCFDSDYIFFSYVYDNDIVSYVCSDFDRVLKYQLMLFVVIDLLK